MNLEEKFEEEKQANVEDEGNSKLNKKFTQL